MASSDDAHQVRAAKAVETPREQLGIGARRTPQYGWVNDPVPTSDKIRHNINESVRIFARRHRYLLDSVLHEHAELHAEPLLQIVRPLLEDS